MPADVLPALADGRPHRALWLTRNDPFHAAEDAPRAAAVRLVERPRARRGTQTARQVAGVRA
ncbi:hypothetical protein [Streptomyces sp. NPDC004134]|uniref:hypothetical protein n=1 Tax=Streptomyces sp. NPDC004134 TaxID=3364691 RepID=UPI0036AB5642